MSSPAVLTPCLLRLTCPGVGRASLTACLLFLQRYARGGAVFSQECEEGSHRSDGLNINHRIGGQVLRCMRLCWGCGHCLHFSLLTLKLYKSQPATVSLPDSFCFEQTKAISSEDALPISCQHGVCWSSSLQLMLKDWSWKLLNMFLNSYVTSLHALKWSGW